MPRTAVASRLLLLVLLFIPASGAGSGPLANLRSMMIEAEVVPTDKDVIDEKVRSPGAQPANLRRTLMGTHHLAAPQAYVNRLLLELGEKARGRRQLYDLPVINSVLIEQLEASRLSLPWPQQVLIYAGVLQFMLDWNFFCDFVRTFAARESPPSYQALHAHTARARSVLALTPPRRLPCLAQSWCSSRPCPYRWHPKARRSLPLASPSCRSP